MERETRRQSSWLKPATLIAIFVGGLVLYQTLTIGRNAPSGLLPPDQPSSDTSVASFSAPDFSLPALDGTPVTLSQYRGKVVMLNAWALWCPPCVVEMPSMQELYDRLKEKGFVILAVEVGRSDASEVKEFVAKHGLRFPVLLDGEGRMRGLYAISGVPETFLVSRNGKLEGRFIGARDWTSGGAVADIERLLDEHG